MLFCTLKDSLIIQRYYLSALKRTNNRKELIKSTQKSIAIHEHCIFKFTNQIQLKENVNDYISTFNNTVSFVKTKKSNTRLQRSGEIYYMDKNKCICLLPAIFHPNNRTHNKLMNKLCFNRNNIEIYGDISDLFYLRLLLELIKSQIKN